MTSKPTLKALLDSRLKQAVFGVFLFSQCLLFGGPVLVAAMGTNMGWTGAAITEYSLYVFVISQCISIPSMLFLGKGVAGLVNSKVKALLTRSKS